MGSRLEGRYGQRSSLALVSFLLLQSLAAIFFIGDVIADLRESPLGPHMILEAVVALALATGVVLSVRQLRQTHERLQEQERTIEAARGEFSQVIVRQFAVWGLTPAEQDVGFLALKGLDVAQIAELRGSAQGTVRAQMTKIYAKAGVSGRAQFAAWFVEDLLGAGLGETEGRSGDGGADGSA